MHHSPRIPEITQRDRFVKRVLATRTVYAVSGEEGLGRVPSRRWKGREVTLLWSSRAEAERWANVIAVNPRIKELPLGVVLSELLPSLAKFRRLIGPDWGSEPIEAEVEPGDLAERLRLEAIEHFAHKVMVTRKVFMLEDSSGPALLVSATSPDLLFLPCWAEREAAEARIEGPWRDMMAIEIPLHNFLEQTLGWLAGRGWMVAPDHWEGAGALELQPDDLKRRFSLAHA